MKKKKPPIIVKIPTYIFSVFTIGIAIYTMIKEKNLIGLMPIGIAIYIICITENIYNNFKNYLDEK